MNAPVRFQVLLLLLLGITHVSGIGQDTSFLQVHILYGSKPKRAFQKSEKKVFGGKLGGHVGIEVESNVILNFVPKGRFHWFAQKNRKHSTYTTHTRAGFYAYSGGHPDSVKKALVRIPISMEQKLRFDSIASIYMEQTPYDYAFLGMRCAAATYEVLGQLDILPPYGKARLVRKVFYPKKLRKRLFKKAKKEGWRIERQAGSERRIWDSD